MRNFLASSGGCVLESRGTDQLNTWQLEQAPQINLTDVNLTGTIDRVHRRDRRGRHQAVRLDVRGRAGDPADNARAPQPARRLRLPRRRQGVITATEATQGQMCGVFSQLLYKCSLNEVITVGD